MAGDQNATFAVIAKDAATAVLRGIGKEMGSFQKNAGKAFKSVAVAAAAVGTAITGALAATAKFAQSAVSAAISDQAEQDKLIAVLKARKMATDSNLASVENLIVAGQKLSFTDTQVRDGISVATRYTNKFSDASKILAAAQNVARANNIDLAQATKIVGMAYAGNGKAAKQLGVDLSKTTYVTTQKIKTDKKGHQTITETTKAIKGQVKGLQAVNLINAKAAGVAQAYANSFQGGMAGIKDSINETVEAIGYAIGGGQGLPTLTKLMKGIRPVIDDIIKTITDNLPQLQEWVASFAEDIPNKVQKAWSTIKRNLPQIKATIGEWITKAREFVDFLIKNVGPEGGIRLALEALGGKIGGKTGIIAVAFGQGFAAIGFDPLSAGIAGALTGTVVSTALDVLGKLITAKIVAAFATGTVATAVTGQVTAGVTASVTTAALAPAAAALGVGLTAGLVLIIAGAITLAIGNALNLFQKTVNPTGNKGPDWVNPYKLPPVVDPGGYHYPGTGTKSPITVQNNIKFGNDAISFIDTKLGATTSFGGSRTNP